MKRKLFLWLLLLLTLAPIYSQAVRIKDIAKVEGIFSEQLIGYGLVVGLAKTGDSYNSILTRQTFANLLKNVGLNIPLEELKMRNVAAVMLTANLACDRREGERIDLLVSSVGDAGDLSGGTLLLTNLRGIDGRVRAVAQGPLWMEPGEQSVYRTTKNLTATVLNGALVVEAGNRLANNDKNITIRLNQSDYSNSFRVTKAVNAEFGEIARARDAGIVEISIPPSFADKPVEFIATLEQLTVVPDHQAKVVLNSRSGTVIMGTEVRVAPVIITQGNIKLVIAPAQETQVGFSEKTDSYATLQDLLDSLNTLNISSRDLIAILQALKKSGALQAELEIL